MPDNSTSLFSVDIPWGIVLSSFLFALVLFYFLFFQQYLTALIWRLFLSLFIPKNIEIQFKRAIISFFSGKITMFDVTIITEDMSFKIDNIAIKLYYWRKIPEFASDQEKSKSRCVVELAGLDMTIHNRAWSTNLVESVKELFESGKTTKEINDFVLSQYPTPAPYQLSVFMRMILPLEFRIYAAQLQIGNPRMPAFLTFRAESISGLYTLFPRKSPEYSIKSYLDLDILTFSLKSSPCTIKETEYFKKSMINIYQRSHDKYQIMKAEDIELHILTDLYGLYVLANEEDLIYQVTQQPQMIIDATFLKSSSFQYGPYMDKLRRYFMEFFAPFVFNDTIFYPEAKKRIKYWVVNLNFPDGSTLEMPFEIEQDETKSQPNSLNHENGEEKQKENGCLIINFGKKSQCQMHIPQYIESVEENKFQLNSLFNDLQISTSIPVDNQGNNPPALIRAESFSLNVNYVYPEIWNDTTNMIILAKFQKSHIVLTPYHIEYLTDFGVDFSSYYPYLSIEETIHNFFPYAYYLNLVFDDLVVKLFSEPYPKYESFYSPEEYPQTELIINALEFRLSLPMLHFQEKQKSVSFSCKIDAAKVNFYLPKNHLMMLRRGKENDVKYDYVLLENFMLSGGYRWSSDPAGDCQIPVSIRISSVDGLLTIGTLVNLIGTIANYTSRDKRKPKVWQKPEGKTIYNYINNTSVVVSIDHGKVKVPLDLYEPNDGAIAHASGILIGVEGYHPFWHVMVDIGCAVVELPRTNFPYDRYFNRELLNETMPKEGTFHVEYIHITMKTISTYTGQNYVDVSTKIGCEIGRIDGICVMPQLFCGLEIAWNIIHTFFSDDTNVIRPFDPFYIYKVEVFRICIGSIHVYLDMGQIGLVCAMLPGGVVVYSDTLIDENAHYVIFVHLPSIDAHIVKFNEEEDRLQTIFRASTYLNVVRDIHFHGSAKEDMIRQNQLLQMYDVIPHPERFVGGSKRNYYSYLFDFINKDKSQLSAEYFFVPEMMRPQTYHSSLNEECDLVPIYLTDSRNNNDYTLMLIELRYPTYKKFINMEDGIQWLHHYETVRFYNHLSPANRHLINIPPANPLTFATQYYADDKFRARDSNGAIRLVLPNCVVVQLVPQALINASALLKAFSLFPDEELLAKVVRSTVGDDFDLKNYHSSTINVILPQVKVLIHGDDFGIALSVDNVNIRSVTTLTKKLIKDAPEGKDKKVSVKFDSNLTLFIKNVMLECSDPESDQPSIVARIPDICLVKVNDKGAAKINPISFYFGASSPSLLKAIIRTLPKYLEDITIPAIGDRCDELVRYLKASPIYKQKLKKYKKKMYTPGECNTRFKVNCMLSALYVTKRKLKLKDFTESYMMMNIPPKRRATNSHLLMTVNLPTVELLIQSSKGYRLNSNEPTMFLAFAPLVIESQREEMFVSCGVRSLKVNLTTDIIGFIKALIPTSADKKRFKKRKLKKQLKMKMENQAQIINDLSNDEYYEYFSDEKNTVASINEYSDEYEEEEEIKASEIFPKPKEKPSDTKILAHFVVDSIGITFNELAVNLVNISLALTLQPSQIWDTSITASFTNFVVSVNKWISIKLDGISLTHDGNINEGFVHVKPISINIYLDFVINAQDYIDLSFVNELLGDISKDDENGNNNNNNSIIDNPLDALISSRSKPPNSNNTNNNSGTSKAEIFDILKKISTSLIIDELSVYVAISSKSRAKIAFPKALGFLFSAENQTNAMCYFQQAKFSAKNYFSFPIPSLMFDIQLRTDVINALLFIGDILIVGKSNQLSNAAALVNEVLSKFDKPKKKTMKKSHSASKLSSNHLNQLVQSARKPGNGDNQNDSKMKINFEIKLLKIEVRVEELSTTLTISRVMTEVELNSAIFWRFNVQEIRADIFDSKIITSIGGHKSKKKNKMSLIILPLEVTISYDLFSKIPLFASFVNVVLQGFEKQKHVNTLLHQLNDNFKQQVESRTETILENIESNELLLFPSILSNNIIFQIANFKFQLLLPPSGALIISTPDISLNIKLKNSPSHSKPAVGAQFQIQNFDIILDNEENLVSPNKAKKKQLSSLHITKFVFSALIFQNDFDFQSVVDGLKLKIFPTIPSSISKLLLVVFALTINIDKAKETLDIHNINSTSNSGNVSPVKPRKSSLLTLPKDGEESPKKNPSSPVRRILSARYPSSKEESESKISRTVITVLFECINTEINLSPIDNKLQVPSIEVQFMFNNSKQSPKSNSLDVSLFVSNKIEASLTPALINYLADLKEMLPYLSPQNQIKKQEQYISKIKMKKEELIKSKVIKTSDNFALSSPTKTRHNRSKSFSSNHDLTEDEDGIFDFSNKLSFTIHVAIKLKNLQICFSCQPRRNEVSCLVGIAGLSVVASTQAKCVSVQIDDLYLHTHNMFSVQSTDLKSSRLFQFNIPRIAVLFGKNKMMVDVEQIFTSFSGDKAEEISLFNDIWIQPFIKMISVSDTNANNNDDNNNVIDANLNLNDSKKTGVDQGTLSLHTSNKNKKTKEKQKEKSSSVLKIEVSVTIRSVELYFNYAAGHGSICLTVQPVYITRTPELIYASIKTISCTSSGQLALNMNANNIYFMSANSNSSLMNVVHLDEIKVSMSMAGDTFLLFSVSQINLLCRIKEEEKGGRNTILELSIDTPQLKMTALTIPTLKTFFKTITEPIINGFERANRAESNIELLSSRPVPGMVENDYKTMPVFPPSKQKQKTSTFSLSPIDKNSLVRHLLFAKLSVVIRGVRIVLLRYVFRDNDAVMFSVDAAMLHLDLKPKGKGMERNLHFCFMPISLVRLTNNEIAPNATNPAGFQPISRSNSSSNLAGSSKQGKNSKSKDKKIVKKNDIEKAKTRPILKIPKVDGSLDTQQKIVFLPDVTYNFYTEFFGHIEPTLNLSDYEMLLALIKYTIANVNLNKGDDNYNKRYHGKESDSDDFFDSISNSNHNNSNHNNSNHNNSNHNNSNHNNSNHNNNEHNSQNNGSKSKSLSGSKASNSNSNEDDTNKVNENVKIDDNMPKIHYNFTPLNYKFAPSFKVGYGASINPDITWLLARFGISDEHIIPASLFQFLCIGLENFLSALTNSMTKANKEDETQ